MVVYPYLGRYRDSARLLAEGRAATLETFKDSTTALNLALAERALGYWAHQDARRTIADLEQMQSVRAKLLSDDYWRTLSAFHMIAGDTAEAGTLLRAHSKNLSEEQRVSIRIFQLAMAGNCEAAETLMRSAAVGKGVPGSSEDDRLYVIARCQLANGAYDAAIASFRRIVDRPVTFANSGPMIPVAWFYLGEAYERKGDVAKATSAYEHVLELWKNGDDDLYCRREARIRLDRLAGTRSM
jgi:tetratricopeptide (TPR) repeat protein